MKNKNVVAYVGGLAALLAVCFFGVKIAGFLEDTHHLGIHVYVYVLITIPLALFAFFKVQNIILEKK